MKRLTAAWLVSYAYLAYVFAGQLPSLGDTVVASLTTSSILLVVLYLFHSYVNFGWRSATTYLIVAVVVSYAFEFVGTQTGIPFGRYAYTSALAPLLGPVPLFIPFLWAALGYFSLLASRNYFVAAALMTLLDVSFDPRFSRSLWRWAVPGQYFGVPLSNFVGWFITALSFYMVFYAVSHRRVASSLPAIGFYFLVGLDNVISDFRSGLGAAGEIAFSLFAASALILLWLRHVRHVGGMEADKGRKPPPESADAPRSPPLIGPQQRDRTI